LWKIYSLVVGEISQQQLDEHHCLFLQSACQFFINSCIFAPKKVVLYNLL
jgi:hypothetical protein